MSELDKLISDAIKPKAPTPSRPVRPVQIAPSILAANFANLEAEVRAVEEAGAEILHLDVMDGCFVPNISFGIPVVRSLRKITRLPLDVHLMIVEPEKYIDAFAEAGADQITVHVEACPHLERTLFQIQETGCRAGVALNPSTSVEFLRYVAHRLDQVLIMTVNPGFGGQSLIEETLPKIQQAREIMQDARKTIDIQVDGGVNKSTAPAVITAGADVLVAGSAIFQGSRSHYKANMQALRG